MSRSSFSGLRRLSKWTPRLRALPLALVLALLVPALAPRPAEASWLGDLWTGFRMLLWAEDGAQILPGGRPAREASDGPSAVWAEQGVQIDPLGLVTPPPTPTDAPERP